MAVLSTTGCGAVVQSTAELDASYEQALADTAALAVRLPDVRSLEGDAGASPPGPTLAGSLARLQALFDAMDGGGDVAALTATVYAEDAYLNDNLLALRGNEAIGRYFADTAGRLDAIGIRMLETGNTGGPDYFVRWEMTVEAPRLNGGQPVSSYGMSHFRFGQDGRVILHKDFWDSGTGLYEHLPVVGRLVRRLRSAAHGG